MASESLIKIRNRKFAADLRKSCKPDAASSPQTRVCHSTLSGDSQDLTKQVLSCFGSSFLESPTSSHDVTHRLSLSLSYRPPALHHRLPASHRRRRRTAHLCSTSCSDVLTPTNASLVSSPKLTPWASGRVSQLASHVESLLIQVPDQSDPFNAVRKANLKPITGLDNLLNRDATFNCDAGCLPDEAVHSHPSERSPWYRHCRPGAPGPPVTPTCHRCVGAQRGAVVEPSDSENLNKHTHRNDSRRGKEIGRLDLSALEMDSDQENRYWSPEFFLPSPPLLGDALVGLGDRPFPSPPLIENHSEHNERKSYAFTVDLVPLAPISNHPQKSIAFETQHPKRPDGCRNSTRGFRWVTASTLEDIGNTEGSDSDSPASLVPSPPPKIVECVPTLHESSWLIRPAAPADKTGQANPNTANDSTYAINPACQLMRGAPDGAEELQIEQWEPNFGEDSRNFKLVLPTASKRVPVSRPTVFHYSPKKSRTHSLVPSEHSAFLPVGSAHTRISSPCIH